MKNKKIEYTNRGYSYIKCTKEDCLNWGGMAICDSCANFMEDTYLIFVLHQAFCPKCFKEWEKRSIRYEDDIRLQKEYQERWYKAHGFKTV